MAKIASSAAGTTCRGGDVPPSRHVPIRPVLVGALAVFALQLVAGGRETAEGDFGE